VVVLNANAALQASPSPLSATSAHERTRQRINEQDTPSGELSRLSLALILLECRDGHLDCFAEQFNDETFRKELLTELLKTHPSLSSAEFKERALGAMLPYCRDELALEYALKTLESPEFQDAPQTVAAAREILVRAADALSAAQLSRLCSLAFVATRASDGDASPLHTEAARDIVRALPLGTLRSGVAQRLARNWYVNVRGRSNPWVAEVGREVSLDAVRFLTDIAEGRISPDSKTSLVRRVIDVVIDYKAIVAISPFLMLGCNKLAALWGAPPIMTFGQAVTCATIVVCGPTIFGVASEFDKLNLGRDLEKIEALIEIASIRERARKGDQASDRRVARTADSVLKHVGQSLLQSPRVCRAAKALLSRLVSLNELSEVIA
jgi:hypothetical protein